MREGRMPPILLLWITGLDRYVILDGHDRLLAALLEGREPPVLALFTLRDRPPLADRHKRMAIAREVAAQLDAARPARPHRKRLFSVEGANKLLIDAFDDRPQLSLTTRAWPLTGGVRAWLGEVRGGLARLRSGDSGPLEMEADPP